ncbi:MAG: GlsB/YeaQ/YmgE family stress response membrane protein [Aliishimia sp.]
MPILWLIIVGAAAGFVATRLLKIEADIITTIVIGMVGAILGGVMLQLAAGLLGLLGGLVGAIAGAMLVVWLWQQVKKK